MDVFRQAITFVRLSSISSSGTLLTPIDGGAGWLTV